MLLWRFWRSSSWAVPLNVPTWSVANKSMQVPARNLAQGHVFCLHEMTYFLSWSLLHLICFDSFHLIWCSPCHPLVWCIWRVSTPLPLLTKWQVVGPCKLASPSFGTCPTSLAIPKAWPGAPDTTLELQFLCKFTVLWALVSYPFFFPCQLLSVDTL